MSVTEVYVDGVATPLDGSGNLLLVPDPSGKLVPAQEPAARERRRDREWVVFVSCSRLPRPNSGQPWELLRPQPRPVFRRIREVYTTTALLSAEPSLVQLWFRISTTYGYSRGQSNHGQSLPIPSRRAAPHPALRATFSPQSGAKGVRAASGTPGRAVFLCARRLIDCMAERNARGVRGQGRSRSDRRRRWARESAILEFERSSRTIAARRAMSPASAIPRSRAAPHPRANAKLSSAALRVTFSPQSGAKRMRVPPSLRGRTNAEHSRCAKRRSNPYGAWIASLRSQ